MNFLKPSIAYGLERGKQAFLCERKRKTTQEPKRCNDIIDCDRLNFARLNFMEAKRLTQDRHQ